MKFIGVLGHPAALEVTEIVDAPAVSLWMVLFVAVKLGRLLSLPELLVNPILSPRLVQLKATLLKVELNIIDGTGSPLQYSRSPCWATSGVGLTAMVKSVDGPVQTSVPDDTV